VSWQVTRLGDVVTLKRGHDLPESRRQDGDIPVVSSSGITGCHREAKAKAPGVVTGRYGTLGEVFYVEEDYWPLNTALYVTDFKGNHPRFVAYFLRNVLKDYQSDKAAVPGVNRNVLHELKVQRPDIKSQGRIADILFSYDDLIENNRRRMVLLEDAARELYREWFVRLRFPGHEHTRIVDGVPEGWEKTSLGALVDVTKGKNITRMTTLEGTVPVVAGGLEPAYFHNEANAKAPIITISASGANAGYVNIYLEDIWASDCSHINGEATDYVYYFYFLLKVMQQEVYTLQKGAAQPHVYPKDLSRLEVFRVPDGLLRLFTDAIEPSFGLIRNLKCQNRFLVMARDLLLQGLMNGEIVV
jgi:type I restriction enzyme S subunit